MSHEIENLPRGDVKSGKKRGDLWGGNNIRN